MTAFLSDGECAEILSCTCAKQTKERREREVGKKGASETAAERKGDSEKDHRFSFVGRRGVEKEIRAKNNAPPPSTNTGARKVSGNGRKAKRKEKKEHARSRKYSRGAGRSGSTVPSERKSSENKKNSKEKCSPVSTQVYIYLSIYLSVHAYRYRYR